MDNIEIKKIIMGFNFLHRHTKTEQMLNIDADHVIVDRKDWEDVIDYFHRNPNNIADIGKKISLTNDNNNAILTVKLTPDIQKDVYVYAPIDAPASIKQMILEQIAMTLDTFFIDNAPDYFNQASKEDLRDILNKIKITYENE